MEVFGQNSYGAKAEIDIKGAKYLEMAGAGNSDNQALLECSLMHYQQAIEKYFKQVLLDQGHETVESLFTLHKVLVLANKAGYNPSNTEVDILRELGNDYESRRYPMPDKDLLPQEATPEFVRAVREVCENVQTFAKDVRRQTSKTALNKLKFD